MSELKRLLDDGATDVERMLLRTLAGEKPAASSAEEAMIAIRHRARVASSVGPLDRWVFSKATVVGMSALLAVGGASFGVSAVASHRAVSRAFEREAEAFGRSTPLLVRAPGAITVTAPVALSSWTPSSANVVEAPVVSGPPPTRHEVVEASLADEILLIDAARRAIAARATGEALKGLDRYQRQFPRGAFVEEAAVLRIEALDLDTAEADRPQAIALARQFLQRRPESPYRERVRRVRDAVNLPPAPAAAQE